MKPTVTIEYNTKMLWVHTYSSNDTALNSTMICKDSEEVNKAIQIVKGIMRVKKVKVRLVEDTSTNHPLNNITLN